MVATRERGSIVFPLPNIDSLRSLTFAHFLQKIPFAPLKPAEHITFAIIYALQIKV